METRPVVSLQALASRDALTKVVVEALDESRAERGDLPSEISAMLDVLPGHLSESIRSAWEGKGRAALMDDACSMILDRLTEKGAES